MKRYALPALLVGLCALAVYALLRSSCQPAPTVVEQHVDSTLAEAPAWADTVKARNAALAEMAKANATLRRDRQRIRDSVRVEQVKADSLQDIANRASDIPTGLPVVEENYRLRAALTTQQQASAQLRIVNAGLNAVIAKDSSVIRLQDATIARQAHALMDADDRVNKLTMDLGALREQTRHKGQWNVLGVHLPGWTKDAVKIGVTAVVAYKAGQAAR